MEVTEEALLVDLSTAATVSQRLRDLGVRLVLDDFGTGYSSLLHLRKLSIQAIKNESGFIHDLDTNTETERFLRALLNLSRDLDIVMSSKASNGGNKPMSSAGWDALRAGPPLRPTGARPGPEGNAN